MMEALSDLRDGDLYMLECHIAFRLLSNMLYCLWSFMRGGVWRFGVTGARRSHRRFRGLVCGSAAVDDGGT